MSQTVIVGGSNYTVPDVGERSWGQNVTDLMIAMATAITGGGGSGGISTQAISTTPVNVVSGKTYLVDTSAPRTFNLPTPAANAYFAIRDVTGGAATNNVTVHRFAAESIDGVAADRVLNIARGYWIFVCDGTNWFSLVNFPIKFAQLDTSASEQLTMPGGSLGALPFQIATSGYGFYNGGSGVVAVAAGAGVCRFDSTGLVLLKGVAAGGNAFTAVGSIAVADGAVGTPSITHTADTNTGIYFTAADNLAIATAGVQRLLITSAGHLVTSAGTDVTWARHTLNCDTSANSFQHSITATADGVGVQITSISAPPSMFPAIVAHSAKAQGSGVGSAILLGGRYDTDTKSTAFAFMRGKKMNSTNTDRSGVMELGATEAAGTEYTKIRIYGGTGTGTVIGIEASDSTTPASVYNTICTIQGSGNPSSVTDATFQVNSSSGRADGNALFNSNDSAAQDLGGSICLGGRYDTAQATATGFARLSGRKENATNNNKSGYFTVETNLAGTGFVERLRLTSDGSLGFGLNSYGGGVKVMSIVNAGTVPTSNPTGGGILYAEAGALKWRGSAGTITTIAVA